MAQKVSKVIIITGDDNYKTRHTITDFPKSIDKVVKQKLTVLNVMGFNARLAPKPHIRSKRTVTTIGN